MPVNSVSIVDKVIKVTVEETPSFNITLNSIAGKDGANGFSGNIDEYITAESIPAFSIVTTNSSGNLILASSANVLHVNKCLGLTRILAAPGAQVIVTYYGRITNNQWNFDITKGIFLGLNGVVTQNPFTGVFTQSIGYPITSNTININIKNGIIRT